MCQWLISLTKSERYGYVTNTKIKFVVVVESANTALRDNEIRTVSDSIIYHNVKLFCMGPETEHRRQTSFNIDTFIVWGESYSTSC